MSDTLYVPQPGDRIRHRSWDSGVMTATCTATGVRSFMMIYDTPDTEMTRPIAPGWYKVGVVTPVEIHVDRPGTFKAWIEDGEIHWDWQADS